MKTSFTKTATESKANNAYFSSFRNCKRVQWAEYRSYNR